MKKISAIFLSLVVGTIISSGVFVTPVSAVSSPSLSPSPSPALPVTSSSTDQLSILKEKYRVQLQTYQSDYQAFLVAKQQYIQLQTLTSLEEAVRATRQVLLSRTDVLITYLTTSRISFDQTTGIELVVKQKELTDLDQLLSDLITYRAHVESALNRAQIAAAVAEFMPLQQRIQTMSGNIQSLIVYGKVQSLYDKTNSVKDEIKVYMNKKETDALRLSQKQRGMEEIENTLQNSHGFLQEILLSVHQSILGDQEHQSVGGTVSYSQISDPLGQAYAGISRTLNFLKEILQS